MLFWVVVVVVVVVVVFFSAGQVARTSEIYERNGGRHRILRKILGRKTCFIFLKKIFFASPGKFSLLTDILSLFIEGGPPSGPEVLLRKCVEKVEFSK